jgi:histidyl-tRNA synthetase
MSYKIPTGLFDILPEDPKELWRCSHVWNYVEMIIRMTAKEFGFQEIRTPIFERAEVFTRSSGESSDIVSKEMYLFKDKGDRLMALRPEGTAPVMRSFIENNLSNQGGFHKFFYICPMFRYDRPQAGRYRQHHQFGVEAIGNRSPEQDAEVIDLLHTLLKRLGLGNLNVQINCIGDKAVRDKFTESLRDYLKPHFNDLSEDSQKRLETNPLRILDSKNEKDRQIVANAPSILDFISEESKSHFRAVQEKLASIGIPFNVDPLLVRGLDYYNEVVFEVTTSDIGAQSSLGGGGRYDGMLKMMKGPDLPAAGFGSGLERIIQTVIKQGAYIPEKDRPTLYVIPIGDKATDFSFQLLHSLRQERISAQMDFSGRKVGKAMQYANQIGAKYTAVIGDEELESHNVELKHMDSGETQITPLRSLPKILTIVERTESFLAMYEEMDKPFNDENASRFFMKNIQRSLEKTKNMTDKFHGRLQEIKKLIKEQSESEKS